MEKTKRIDWIDAVRGLGIISIIVFHTGFLPFNRILNPLLLSWMLPVFAFTGGWLLKNTPFTLPRLFSTANRLLKPFFISGIVSFTGWLFLQNIYPQQILKQPLSLELIKWLTGRNAYFNSPLWFIPTYFFASVIMQLIAVRWFRSAIIIRGIFAIIFIIAGFFLSRSYQYPVFSYDLIVLFIGMIMTGSVASTIHFPKSLPRFSFDVFITIIFIAFSLLNGYVDLFQRQFGNEFLYFVNAGLGTYCVARLVIYGRLYYLSFLGQSSMSLMAWHWPISQWLTSGLFATGILQQITTNYTKTSFIIKAEGFQLFLLQIVFCGGYTIVSLGCVFIIKRLWRQIKELFFKIPYV